jgi:hypothetical protein
MQKKTPYFITGHPTHNHILYPWVNMELGSNSRKQHRYKTKERRDAREAGYFITIDANIFLMNSPIELDFVFCPPDKIWRDDDNIMTAFKSTRDGIFLALGLDDKLVRKTIISWGKVTERGCIYLRLTNISKEEYENG